MYSNLSKEELERIAQQARAKALADYAQNAEKNKALVEKTANVQAQREAGLINDNLIDALSYGAKTGANNIEHGFDSAWTGLKHTGTQMLGMQDAANSLAQKLQENAQAQAQRQAEINSQYNTNFGMLAKGVSDITSGAVGMLPTIGAALITPQGKAVAAGRLAQAGAKALRSIPSMGVMGTQVAGSGINQALNEGADIEQAKRYGAGSAVKEVATELPFAGIAKVPGLVNVGQKIAGGNKIVGGVINAATEGAEEAAAEYLDPFIQRATYNPNAENASFDDMLYSALIGAGTAGLINSGFAGASKAANVAFNGKNPLKNAQKIGNAVQNAQNGAEQAQDTGMTNTLPRPNNGSQNGFIEVEKIRKQMEKEQQALLDKKLALREQIAQLEQAEQEKWEREVKQLEETVNILKSARSNAFNDALFNAMDEYTAPQQKEKLEFDMPMAERTLDNVSNPKVKAYQSTHPEVKAFFREQAEIMLNDLNNMIDGGREYGFDPETRNVTTVRSQTRMTSSQIDKLMNAGMTKAQIKDGLERIIRDNGAENTANAKKVETTLDDSLMNGYQSMQGRIPKNLDYAYRGADVKKMQDAYRKLDTEEAFANTQHPEELINELEYLKERSTERQQLIDAYSELLPNMSVYETMSAEQLHEEMDKLESASQYAPDEIAREMMKRHRYLEQLEEGRVNEFIENEGMKPHIADAEKKLADKKLELELPRASDVLKANQKKMQELEEKQAANSIFSKVNYNEDGTIDLESSILKTLPRPQRTYADYDLSKLSEEVRDFYDMVNEAGQQYGFTVRIVDGIEHDANGVFDGNGNILLDGNKMIDEATISRVLGHEVYHYLKGTDQHKYIIDLALQGKDRSAEIIKKYNKYANAGVELRTEDGKIDTDAVLDEIGAEFMEQILSDPQVAERIWDANPTLAERIIRFFEDIINRLQGKAMSDTSRKALEAYQQGLRNMQYQQQGYGGTQYSLPNTDTSGRELTAEQADYFKNSKVRDEQGNLKVMYHGSPNAGFTEFRSGTYFTPMKWYADGYKKQGASMLSYKKTADNPDTYEVYLNIEKPFDTRNPKERRIFEKEFYGQWGNGAPLADSGLPDWTDGMDLQEFIEEKGYDYDGLILDEGAVGGYGEEVKSRGLSYVVFSPEQVKNVDNQTPTKSSDIRYSLPSDKDYLDAVNRGDIETAQRMVNEAAEIAGYSNNDDYRGSHYAPVAQIDKKDFTNLDKLRELEEESWDLNLFAIANGISLQPDDYFGPNGARWYMYDDYEGMESYRALKRAMNSIQSQMKQYGEVRNMPTVKVYRAVPKGVKESKLQSGGQWVTPSRQYAIEHGEQHINGAYRIIEEDVSAENLWWDANDIREWGFDDGQSYAYRNTKNNRKLLDAVTYDDDGNVIPLSKRFKYRNADMRYSLDDLVDEYGAIPKGEDPYGTNRDIDIPQQTADDNKVSRFARTAVESANVDDSTVGMIEDELTDDIQTGRFIYEPTGNQEQIDRANGLINHTGWEQQLEQFRNKYRSGQAMTADDIVLGERLIQEAQRHGDYKTAVDLIADIAAIGTELGRAVQALSVLKRLTPQGKVQALKRVEERINSGLLEQGKQPVKLSDELLEQMLQAESQQMQSEIWDSCIENMANQVPATLADKVNAWRYLAMLSNPKTHIRNMMGNSVMRGVSAVKRGIQASLENRLLTAGEERYTELNRNVPKEYFDFAEISWQNEGKKRAEASGGRYNDAIGQVERNKRIFNTEWLEKWRKGNENALFGEDMMFKKSAYINALARYMHTNGLAPSELQSVASNASYEKGVAFALKEADKATFQEASKVANLLSRMEHSSPASKLLMGGALPFKKTPINILKRGVEYSPVGLMNGLYKMRHDVQTGKMTKAEAIDAISAGLTGTGIMVLGYFMASMGLITGGAGEDDERKQWYDQSMGSQNYALVLPNGGTATIDWLAPSVMPLMAGAELYKQLTSENPANENSSAVTSTLEAISKVANPVLEMSMLQGVTDALQSYNSGTTGVLSDLITSTATSYGGQFIPAPVGALARTVDDTVRSSYAPKDSAITKTGEKFVRQQMNKLPFASMANEPSIDVWGNEVERTGGNIVGRAFNNFINPSTYSSDKRTELDKELEKLYSATGESTVLPKAANSSFKYKEKTYYMTSQEKTTYDTTKGQKAKQYVTAFVNSAAYNSMDDNAKADIIAELYNLANYEAKKQMLKGRGINDYEDSAYEKVLASKTSPAVYYAMNAKLNDTKADKDKNGKSISGSRQDKVVAYLNAEKKAGRINDEQWWYFYVMEYPSQAKNAPYAWIRNM